METTTWGVGFRVRPLIHTPPPFKGLNVRIPIIIPSKGRGLINQRPT